MDSYTDLTMDSYGPFILTGLTMNYIATLKAPHNEKKNYIATQGAAQ